MKNEWYIWVRSSKAEEPTPKIPIRGNFETKEEAELHLATQVVQHSPWLEYGVDKKGEI